MYKYLSIMFLAVLLSGCTGLNGTLDLSKPVSLNLTPPEGSYAYEQGWSDGCESALVSGNTHVMQFFKVNEYRYDSQLRYNPVYERVWNNAYYYCAYYMFSRLRYNI